MDRRDLLKGLLALPAAAALRGYGAPRRETQETTPNATSLQVILNGPFALVWQPGVPGITAVSPRVSPPNHRDDRDANGMQHQFYFNGMWDTAQNYNFTLPSNGLKVRPQLDPKTITSGENGFGPFNTSNPVFRDMNLGKRKDEYFVTLQLPTPDKITFRPPRRAVKLSKGNGFVWMPLNQILEYSITDPTKVMVTDNKIERKAACKPDDSNGCYPLEPCGGKAGCVPPPAACPRCAGGAHIFFFEVGLVINANDMMAKRHAINFFNQRLIESFPGLEKTLQLTDIDGTTGDPLIQPYKDRPGSKGISTSNRRQAAWSNQGDEGEVIPAVFTSDLHPHLLQTASDTHCDTGGLIVEVQKVITSDGSPANVGP